MGRITIFAIDECPFCVKTKAALTELEIPYTEINLSSYPEKRSDMLALSDQLTVPQVFFNDKHIGGADDTIAVLEKWEEENTHPTALLRYQEEIESELNPTDSRLDPPSTPPKVVDPPPERSEADKILLPNGEHISVLDLTQELIKILPKYDISQFTGNYMSCFKGLSCVAALLTNFGITEREEAFKFCLLLQERKILHHVKEKHLFEDNTKLYRLQPYHSPGVLNSYRIWNDRVEPDHMALIFRLAKMIGKIMSDVTGNDGKVDYILASKHINYPAFEEAVCEIQGVSMSDMDDKTKIAFGTNLYNLMIRYAFAKVGIPKTNLQRMNFFKKVSFNIGGEKFSFNDLENGILRGNSKAPHALKKPFSPADSRLPLIVKNVDPRIHFALNCGAKSCPPVKKFTSSAIEEELRIVASAFAEQDENVLVDEEKNVLHLTLILKWYRSDFEKIKGQLPETLLKYLRGEKKEKLKRMIESKKPIKLKYNTYDWSTDASESKKFEQKQLKANQLSASTFLMIILI